MVRLTIVFAAASLALVSAQASAKERSSQPHTVTVGIAAINDFHGSLEPPKQSVVTPDGKGGYITVPAGGAAWLASAIDSVRTQYRHHLTISAGDMIGGSPFNSASFLDEPAIGVMNRIGLDFNAVGNHEFDSGIEELLRKQKGGCSQHTAIKPCQIEKFKGAQATFLAANTIRDDGSSLLPATAIRSFGKGRMRVKVGLIGLTLKNSGLGQKPENVKGIRFADEADTANALVGKLKAEGVDAVVVVIHQGGRTSDPGPDACPGLYGEIRPILDRLDNRVDLIISGHTHWDYVCEYSAYNQDKSFLMTSAGLWGKMVTDITLEIDPLANRVVNRKARNVIVQSPGYQASTSFIPNRPEFPQFEPRKDVADYVAKYVRAADDVAKRPVGKIAAPIDKLDGPLANTGGSLGNLIADAQLAATTGAGAQIALMNPFGIRRSLGAAPDGTVTFVDLYAVQPFRNRLVTVSLTGTEIKEVLEQGFDAIAPEQVLAPSSGFAFTYDRSFPIGSRVTAISLNGAPIDSAKIYRVTSSRFLFEGGDSFAAFTKGRDPVEGILEIDALEAWLKALPPRSAPQEVRAIDARPDLNPLKRNAPPGQKYR